MLHVSLIHEIVFWLTEMRSWITFHFLTIGADFYIFTGFQSQSPFLINARYSIKDGKNTLRIGKQQIVDPLYRQMRLGLALT